MRKPIWLLDFDGVINTLIPVTAEVPREWQRSDWLSIGVNDNGNYCAVDAARPVLEFLRQVHESGQADIRWHTTWQDRIGAVAAKLGLPDFPVEPAPEYSYFDAYYLDGCDDAWWKLPAIERLADAGYRVLWTDDDLVSRLTPARRNSLRASGCYLVCPGPDGLGPKELKLIDSYLSAGNTPVLLDGVV